jgi:hypothetical protein
MCKTYQFKFSVKDDTHDACKMANINNLSESSSFVYVSVLTYCICICIASVFKR